MQTDSPDYSQYQMPDNQTVWHSQSIFDEKNHFDFLALVQSKIELFSSKTYKISEQQINPKVLSVANSCHYNENFKNGKNRLQTASQELLRQIPAPGKRQDAKTQGGRFLVEIPGGARGMVMAKIDGCIMY